MYGYSMRNLFAALQPYAPRLVEILASTYREVKRGRLPVGLKLHCLDGGPQFFEIIYRLGGVPHVINSNYYRRAWSPNREEPICFVLPPVGSADSAILFLEILEIATRSKIFGNKLVQIQVCSPGRLNELYSAILSIGFCLGSDILRTFALWELETTFSNGPYRPRGRRLALYDANGQFDVGFNWWRRLDDGRLAVDTTLPFRSERTDILTATSRKDIQNINLFASLLVHEQHNGFWKRVGDEFVNDMIDMLHRHDLTHIVDAQWIVVEEDQSTLSDGVFQDMLNTLTSYALEDAERVQKTKSPWLVGEPEPEGAGSLLLQTQGIVRKYNEVMFNQLQIIH